MRQNELSYLIYVRYVVIIPFWFVNVSAALLGAKFETFVLSTFVATIPGSLLLTTAGRGLSNMLELSNDSDISTFSLVKQAMWSRDMQYCFLLLLLCLIIPLIVKYYNKNVNSSNNNSNSNSNGNTRARHEHDSDDDDESDTSENDFNNQSLQNKFVSRLKHGTGLTEAKLSKIFNFDRISWNKSSSSTNANNSNGYSRRGMGQSSVNGIRRYGKKAD